MVGVSVIIPVYNTEAYIVECIESVLANDYKEFEIICVDDGSKDSSLQLIQNLAQKHKCIKVVSQQNKGQSAARNKAIQMASGKYLYFLDSDDKISSDALGKLYNYLEEDNLDVLYFSGDSFFDSDELAEKFNQFSTVYMRKGKYEGVCDGLAMLQQLREKKDYSVSPCIQIIRKDYLLGHNIDFYEGIIHEDNIFSFKVIVNAKRAKCINDVYFHRRIRHDSVMTANKTYRNLLGYYKCFLSILNYACQMSLDNEQRYVVNGIIRALRMHVHKNYFAIDNDERNLFLDQLDFSERLFFDSVILHEMETEVQLKKQVQEAKKEVHDVRNCRTFKVGRVVVWPLAIVKRFVLKIWRIIHG